MRLFRKMKEAGFSLVELLVVVAIIAMLAAVGLPMYNRYKAKSAQNAATSSARQYVNAFKSAYGAGNDDFKISGLADTFQVDTMADHAACNAGVYPNYDATDDAVNCFITQPFRDSTFTLDCVVYVRPFINQGETEFNVQVYGAAAGSAPAAIIAGGVVASCYDLVGGGTTGDVLSATAGDVWAP